MLETEVFLGDGAYAKFDGFGIEVYTSNGIEKTNTVYLEPEVYNVLTQFVDKFFTLPVVDPEKVKYTADGT